MKKCEIIKLTALVLVFVLLTGIGQVFAEGFDKFGLIINDTHLNKEIAASTLEGITYIPLSRINAFLGISITKEADKLILSRQNHRLVLIRQQDKAFPEGSKEPGSLYAYIKNDVIYVPVLHLTDYLKLEVEVLYDISCIRILTKNDALLAGQIYDRSLSPEAPVKKPSETKTAYLTFDDGLEGKVTPQILDILKLYNVKATFFIVGNTVSKNKDILKRLVDEGHSVGNHSYTHRKDIIYSNVESFVQELAKTTKAIYDVTGITTRLFRPPYGAPYIRKQEYKDALAQYKIVLWNVDSMDSRVKGITSAAIAAEVKRQVQGKKEATILFHNTSAKEETAKALPEIIQYLLDNGYNIESLK